MYLYITVISLFDSEEILCLCLRVCFVIVVWFSFVSTPVCRNGAGRQVYMFIVLSSSASQVLVSGMCIYVDLLFDDWFLSSTPFRG